MPVTAADRTSGLLTFAKGGDPVNQDVSIAAFIISALLEEIRRVPGAAPGTA